MRLVDARSNALLREDFVSVEGAPGSLRFGYVPLNEDPLYAILPNGKWQCLDLHGKVLVEEISFVEEYVPVSERPGFVYFIRAGDDGAIKIGWSQDVEFRKAQLQTGNALPLKTLAVMAGTLELEKALHLRFAHLRLESEWFRGSQELLTFINGIQAIERAKT